MSFIYLPNEILIDIFIHIKYMKGIPFTCKKFYKLIINTQFKFDWITFHYKSLSDFEVFQLGFTFFNSELIKKLQEKKELFVEDGRENIIHNISVLAFFLHKTHELNNEMKALRIYKDLNDYYMIGYYYRHGYGGLKIDNKKADEYYALSRFSNSVFEKTFFDNILNITNIELKYVSQVTKSDIIRLHNLKSLSLIDIDINNDDILFVMRELKYLSYLKISYNIEYYKKYDENKLIEESMKHENIKIGSGISTLANVITDTILFKESKNTLSETQEIQIEKFELEGVEYRIIDTVGISNSNLSDKQVIKKMKEAFNLIKGETNLVFFTFSGRFTERELKALELLKIVFGNEFNQNIILVRTKFCDFRNSEKCKLDIDSLLQHNKETFDLITNHTIIHKGEALVNILYNGLSKDYQRLLLDKEIYIETFNPFFGSELEKITFTKKNYMFNYASYINPIPCSSLSEYINYGKDKDYVIDINEREKIEVFHVMSNKKYLIDSERGCCGLNFWNLGKIDDDWHHCHDLSYHFTEFILKKLLIFKYLKEKNSKIKEIYEDLFKWKE
ncbi:11661_t:CDS:2 [Scutellospora calospora]|uniref:11661_t:CDS:1 n=1 Tax=Scutellospora calospora TaxID=85575 RepID=A0ACA9KK01_9GLOM|nr:11661_t:CDS:2 [Scutellospora calospora]